MLIKCENCSVVYEVPDERLASEQPRFLKCSACGSVFAVPTAVPTKEEKVPEKEKMPSVEEEILPEKSLSSDNVSSIPPVEQTDSIPMALSDIFSPQEDLNESTEITDIEENKQPKQPEKEKEVNLFEPLDDTEEFSPVASDFSQNKHFGSFLISLIIAFIAALLLFYVGRYFFIRKIPSTEKVYQSIGLKTDVLGEGLAFQETLFDIQKNNKNYELIIKSQIVNTTDETKQIPNVVVRLLDEKDNVLQSGHINLPNTSVKAGQTQPIETHLKELAAGAKRVEITFERKANW
ncbi:MAG: zinc-ribbon domain-containing protein [Alphaproteobacteria bacterium]|nr:zinc-ribbon domain-containing protein [Alphaproteobacteria bacterium]